MKIIAWNINSIKTSMKGKDLYQLLQDEKPDIICFGETKVSCPFDDIQNELKENIGGLRYRYWSPCKVRAGYSGTAIFSKKEPLKIIYGLKHNDKEIDDEGRVITLEYDKFILLHVYTPNSGQALARLDYRVKIWDRVFEEYIKKLQKHKPVIVCGDLNVAHKEIDLKNPKTNLRTAGFTIEERESFDKILDNNKLIDTYRLINGDKIEYSFWSYRGNARKKNVGWRIDYFLVSEKLKNNIKKSEILTNYMGSDHAPIKLKVSLK